MLDRFRMARCALKQGRHERNIFGTVERHRCGLLQRLDRARQIVAIKLQTSNRHGKSGLIGIQPQTVLQDALRFGAFFRVQQQTEQALARTAVSGKMLERTAKSLLCLRQAAVIQKIGCDAIFVFRKLLRCQLLGPLVYLSIG